MEAEAKAAESEPVPTPGRRLAGVGFVSKCSASCGHSPAPIGLVPVRNRPLVDQDGQPLAVVSFSQGELKAGQGRGKVRFLEPAGIAGHFCNPCASIPDLLMLGFAMCWVKWAGSARITED